MSVNILTASGLINLSGDKVTKDTITSALGYVPADEEALPDIVDDDSGVLYIVDSNGNIICTIDADGLHTVEVTLNGEKVSEKLASLSNVEIDTSNLVDLTSAQTISGSKTFTSPVPVSLQGGANIPSDKSLTWGGLLSLVASATGMTGQATLTLPQETGTLATQEWVGENQTELEAHVSDETIHITSDERSTWNGKSDFSGNYEDLAGAPDITTDEDDNSLYIIDANGNVIFKVDAGGIRTTSLETDGQSNFYGDVYLRTGRILADVDADPYEYKLPTQSGTLATREWVGENVSGSNLTKQTFECLSSDSSRLHILSSAVIDQRYMPSGYTQKYSLAFYAGGATSGIIGSLFDNDASTVVDLKLYQRVGNVDKGRLIATCKFSGFKNQSVLGSAKSETASSSSYFYPAMFVVNGIDGEIVVCFDDITDPYVTWSTMEADDSGNITSAHTISAVLTKYSNAD